MRKRMAGRLVAALGVALMLVACATANVAYAQDKPESALSKAARLARERAAAQKPAPVEPVAPEPPAPRANMPTMVLTPTLGSAPAAVPVPVPGGPPPATMQTAYVGEIRRFLPTGEQSGLAGALLRRTATPPSGMIVEQVVAIEPGETPRESFAMLQVDGAKLSISEREARYTGDGELQGAPWYWNSWTTRLDLAGGTGSVRATFTVTAEGLAARRLYYSPSGELRMIQEELYRPISSDLFEVLYQQLVPRH